MPPTAQRLSLLRKRLPLTRCRSRDRAPTCIYASKGPIGKWTSGVSDSPRTGSSERQRSVRTNENVRNTRNTRYPSLKWDKMHNTSLVRNDPRGQGNLKRLGRAVHRPTSANVKQPATIRVGQSVRRSHPLLAFRGSLVRNRDPVFTRTTKSAKRTDPYIGQCDCRSIAFAAVAS